MRSIVTCLIASCLFAPSVAEARSAPARTAQDETVGAFRLLIADAKSPAVRVLDLDSGTVLATYTLGGPARLHRGASGQYVYAVQGQSAQVAVIDTGIALDSHGDHADIKISKPRLLPVRLSGPKPSHFNRGGVLVVVFFDGDGSAQAIKEPDLVRGNTRQLRRIETGAGHHGVAKPVGSQIAISVPPDGQGLPNAIELRGRDNKPSQRADCPRMHGAGATSRFVGFGCANGVVIFEAKRDGVAARHIAYPEAVPAGRMIRNMAGATGFSFLAGDFGADGMVVLDPAAKDGDFRYVELPGRRMHFDLHPDPGDKLYVVLEDGTLLSINPLTGAIEARARVTDRYSMEQDVVRPRVTSAGSYAIVSNPAAGEIVILDAQTLAERRRVKIEGVPFDVLAVGGRGATH